MGQKSDVAVRGGDGQIAEDGVISLTEAAFGLSKIITIEPGQRGGRPCVRGMRIAVADVLGWLAAGMSHQQISAIFRS